MSIILDALRKLEREKPVPGLAVNIDRRAPQSGADEIGGHFQRHYSGLMAAGALAAFAGGFCFAEGMAGRDPLSPQAAEAMTTNETAVFVSTAAGSRVEARDSVEETRNAAADPQREQGAGPLDGRGEIPSRTTAGPVLSAPENRIEPRGTEPPVHHDAQAAPAPVFLLDGIVHHDDPDKRAALLRVLGGESALIKMGGRMRGYRVNAIGRSGVTLAAARGKKIELALD